jgi:hypothetical protein
VSGAVFEQDDSVGSSHDADVDAGYDDDQPASDTAAGSEDVVGGGQTSQDADVDAAYEDD